VEAPPGQSETCTETSESCVTIHLRLESGRAVVGLFSGETSYSNFQRVGAVANSLSGRAKTTRGVTLKITPPILGS